MFSLKTNSSALHVKTICTSSMKCLFVWGAIYEAERATGQVHRSTVPQEGAVVWTEPMLIGYTTPDHRPCCPRNCGEGTEMHSSSHAGLFDGTLNMEQTDAHKTMFPSTSRADIRRANRHLNLTVHPPRLCADGWRMTYGTCPPVSVLHTQTQTYKHEKTHESVNDRTLHRHFCEHVRA